MIRVSRRTGPLLNRRSPAQLAAVVIGAVIVGAGAYGLAALIADVVSRVVAP